MEKVRGATHHWGNTGYEAKPEGYFQGARADYISELPVDPQARILEIGCGEGGTGYLALKEQRCGRYCGVELLLSAAEKAKERITEVVLGDVEKIELPWPIDYFDVLILSEVLEHISDPWAVLRKLRPILKQGARVFASSPNVSNHRIVSMLIRGDWALTDMGAMDKTHLRWFTPRSYKSLFESSGYVVDSVGPFGTLSSSARALSMLSFGRLRHLFISQIDLRGHRP